VRAVRQYWSDPAKKLGLPLIASIYEQGFYVACEWCGAELDQLSAEIGRLEVYWQKLPLAEGLQRDLCERAATVWDAINAAKKCDGVLMIA
jgi:hypothetical protein